jgi:hypothetical protein
VAGAVALPRPHTSCLPESREKDPKTDLWTWSPLTSGRAQRQQDDHGVDYKNVHGGRLPTRPAQEDLVLRL